MNKTTTLEDLVKLKIKIKSTEPQGVFEPSAMVILNILNYSKALSVRKNSYLGEVEMLLN